MRFLRGRRYSIKRRGEDGRSARQQAFDFFWEGHRPAQVCKVVPISLRTACRYFEDFKKLSHRVPYSTIRKWLRQHPEISEAVITMLAANLEMSRDEVVARIEKPWGLLQAMKGEWPNYGVDRQRTEMEERLLAALEVIQFADKFGQKNPQVVRETLRRLITDRGEESSRT